MNFELKNLCEEHTEQFKKDMQEAFQQGVSENYGEMEEEALPEFYIDQLLNTEGAVAYAAYCDGNLVGGAIVMIDEKTQHNHLELFYVKVRIQSRGIGKAIWTAIEKQHPDTKKWETSTPFFEKRNIHFYVNKCGFHIVEFFNKYHVDPEDMESYECEEGELYGGKFRFEKVI